MVDMERRLMHELIHWKTKPDRKPLVLQGARQVGKTHLLKEFGRTQFDYTAYINLEADTVLAREFEGELAPERLVRLLESYTGIRIIPDRTLLIIDEVQAKGRALTALKYFCEQAPQYHVVAAGSLLGVSIHREEQSFPVGRVDSLTLHPLDFEEFLLAHDRNALVQSIREAYAHKHAMAEALHSQALDYYRMYLVSGGMPAVIIKYLEHYSFSDTTEIQSGILDSYIADMAKYATASESVKIRAAYNSIPAQLAKNNRKFQYKTVQRGGTASIFGPAIDWLEFAGIVLKAGRLALPQMPLAAYVDIPSFKLYMADVGLLVMKAGLPSSIVLSSFEQNIPFLGAVSENYVAQQLRARGIPLYYWESDGIAELDFIIQKNSRVVPIEVKAGVHTRSRSLSVYREKFKPDHCIRISQKNFGLENGIFSLPLYAVFCLGFADSQ